MAPRAAKGKSHKQKGEKRKKEEKTLPVVLDVVVNTPTGKQIIVKGISTDKILDVRRLLAEHVETCHITRYGLSHEIRGADLRESLEITALKPCVLTMVEDEYKDEESVIVHVRRLLDLIACTTSFGPSAKERERERESQESSASGAGSGQQAAVAGSVPASASAVPPADRDALKQDPSSPKADGAPENADRLSENGVSGAKSRDEMENGTTQSANAPSASPTNPPLAAVEARSANGESVNTSNVDNGDERLETAEQGEASRPMEEEEEEEQAGSGAVRENTSKDGGSGNGCGGGRGGEKEASAAVKDNDSSMVKGSGGTSLSSPDGSKSKNAKTEAAAAMAAAAAATEKGDMTGMCPPSMLGQFYEFFSMSHLTPPILSIRHSKKPPPAEKCSESDIMYLDVKLCNGKKVAVACCIKGFYALRSEKGKQMATPIEHTLVALLRKVSRSFAKAYDDLLAAFIERNKFANIPAGFRSNTWVVPPPAAAQPAAFPPLPVEDELWGGDGGGQGKEKDRQKEVRPWMREFRILARMACKTQEERLIRDRKAFLLHSLFVDMAIRRGVSAINEAAARLDSQEKSPAVPSDMESATAVSDGASSAAAPQLLSTVEADNFLIEVERDAIHAHGPRPYAVSVVPLEKNEGKLTRAELAEHNLLKGLTADESTAVHDTATLATVTVRQRGLCARVRAVDDERPENGQRDSALASGSDPAATSNGAEPTSPHSSPSHSERVEEVIIDAQPDGGANALNVNSLRLLLHKAASQSGNVSSGSALMPSCGSSSNLATFTATTAARSDICQFAEEAGLVMRDIFAENREWLLKEGEEENDPFMRWELGACWLQHLQNPPSPATKKGEEGGANSDGGESSDDGKGGGGGGGGGGGSRVTQQQQTTAAARNEGEKAPANGTTAVITDKAQEGDTAHGGGEEVEKSKEKEEREEAEEARDAQDENEIDESQLRDRLQLDAAAFERLKESGTGLHKKTIEELMEGAREYYEKTALPKLVADFGSLELSPVDGRTLTDFMHTRGLRMRSLGRLAELAENLSHVKSLCIHEMVVRACKHIVRVAVARCAGSPILMAHVVAAALNVLFGKPPAAADSTGDISSAAGLASATTTAPAAAANGNHGEDSTSTSSCQEESTADEHPSITVWKWIEGFIKRRYHFDLPAGTRDELRKLAMLRGVCNKVGIEIAPRNYDMDSPNPFTPLDIISLFPVYKHVACTSADGRTLLESSKTALDKGKLDDAIAYGTKALARLVAVCGPRHRMTAGAYSLLAVVLYHTGDFNQSKGKGGSGGGAGAGAALEGSGSSRPSSGSPVANGSGGNRADRDGAGTAATIRAENSLAATDSGSDAEDESASPTSRSRVNGSQQTESRGSTQSTTASASEHTSTPANGFHVQIGSTVLVKSSSQDQAVEDERGSSGGDFLAVDDDQGGEWQEAMPRAKSSGSWFSRRPRQGRSSGNGGSVHLGRVNVIQFGGKGNTTGRGGMPAVQRDKSTHVNGNGTASGQQMAASPSGALPSPTSVNGPVATTAAAMPTPVPGGAAERSMPRRWGVGGLVASAAAAAGQSGIMPLTSPSSVQKAPASAKDSSSEAILSSPSGNNPPNTATNQMITAAPPARNEAVPVDHGISPSGSAGSDTKPVPALSSASAATSGAVVAPLAPAALMPHPIPPASKRATLSPGMSYKDVTLAQPGTIATTAPSSLLKAPQTPAASPAPGSISASLAVAAVAAVTPPMSLPAAVAASASQPSVTPAVSVSTAGAAITVPMQAPAATAFDAVAERPATVDTIRDSKYDSSCVPVADTSSAERKADAKVVPVSNDTSKAKNSVTVQPPPDHGAGSTVGEVAPRKFTVSDDDRAAAAAERVAGVHNEKEVLERSSSRDIIVDVDQQESISSIENVIKEQTVAGGATDVQATDVSVSSVSEPAALSAVPGETGPDIGPTVPESPLVQDRTASSKSGESAIDVAEASESRESRAITVDIGAECKAAISQVAAASSAEEKSDAPSVQQQSEVSSNELPSPNGGESVPTPPQEDSQPAADLSTDESKSPSDSSHGAGTARSVPEEQQASSEAAPDAPARGRSVLAYPTVDGPGKIALTPMKDGSVLQPSAPLSRSPSSSPSPTAIALTPMRPGARYPLAISPPLTGPPPPPPVPFAPPVPMMYVPQPILISPSGHPIQMGGGPQMVQHIALHHMVRPAPPMHTFGSLPLPPMLRPPHMSHPIYGSFSPPVGVQPLAATATQPVLMNPNAAEFIPGRPWQPSHVPVTRTVSVAPPVVVSPSGTANEPTTASEATTVTLVASSAVAPEDNPAATSSPEASEDTATSASPSISSTNTVSAGTEEIKSGTEEVADPTAGNVPEERSHGTSAIDNVPTGSSNGMSAIEAEEEAQEHRGSKEVDPVNGDGDVLSDPEKVSLLDTPSGEIASIENFALTGGKEHGEQEIGKTKEVGDGEGVGEMKSQGVDKPAAAAEETIVTERETAVPSEDGIECTSLTWSSDVSPPVEEACEVDEAVKVEDCGEVSNISMTSVANGVVNSEGLSDGKVVQPQEVALGTDQLKSTSVSNGHQIVSSPGRGLSWADVSDDEADHAHHRVPHLASKPFTRRSSQDVRVSRQYSDRSERRPGALDVSRGELSSPRVSSRRRPLTPSHQDGIPSSPSSGLPTTETSRMELFVKRDYRHESAAAAVSPAGGDVERRKSNTQEAASVGRSSSEPASPGPGSASKSATPATGTSSRNRGGGRKAVDSGDAPAARNVEKTRDIRAANGSISATGGEVQGVSARLRDGEQEQPSSRDDDGFTLVTKRRGRDRRGGSGTPGGRGGGGNNGGNGREREREKDCEGAGRGENSAHGKHTRDRESEGAAGKGGPGAPSPKHMRRSQSYHGGRPSGRGGRQGSGGGAYISKSSSQKPSSTAVGAVDSTIVNSPSSTPPSQVPSMPSPCPHHDSAREQMPPPPTPSQAVQVR
ncbi:hypothetical protein CBR_g37662 [Chara braunii]|uniref:Clu domain-containing protein n=1 Tax=Chara braunii TaxID=69332 RepID=A0A388LNQ2_CHABU|nr:hypothetical protein CBR_g37662 [Chara braunii]|eukprot:GBG83865.1 hypothetical protein CBR_g37662 [Chara braunii]